MVHFLASGYGQPQLFLITISENRININEYTKVLYSLALTPINKKNCKDQVGQQDLGTITMGLVLHCRYYKGFGWIIQQTNSYDTASKKMNKGNFSSVIHGRYLNRYDSFIFSLNIQRDSEFSYVMFKLFQILGRQYIGKCLSAFFF